MQLQHQLCKLADHMELCAVLMISDGQGDRCIPEEYRDHEDNESIGQITAVERDNEGDEYGDDEGKMKSCERLDEAHQQSGIMEEMMEETLDSVNDDEELEQEADEEVDKVLYELTDGKLGQAGRVGAELPVSSIIERSMRLPLIS